MADMDNITLKNVDGETEESPYKSALNSIVDGITTLAADPTVRTVASIGICLAAAGSMINQSKREQERRSMMRSIENSNKSTRKHLRDIDSRLDDLEDDLISVSQMMYRIADEIETK